MDTTNKEDSMNSDTENWVMINACDIAEEAITLNKTTESDNESESSISIISGVPTPIECHSDEEAVPNRESSEEIEKVENLSTSSVEKIEISDEEINLLQKNVTSLPPVINVSEVIKSSLIFDTQNLEIFKNNENIDKEKKDTNKDELLTKRNEILVQDKPEEKPLVLICPTIIIENAEKIIDYETNEEILPREQVSTEEKESNILSLNEMIEDQINESSREIDQFEVKYQEKQYDLPPTIVDDSDSWTDIDSSSDDINQDNQIAMPNSPPSHRQEGMAAVTSQNGLFIGAMFVFATALLKLYLLKDNADLPDQNAFSYELNKLKEQYQSVDMHYNSQIDPSSDANLKTIVQFCTTKHDSNNDPFDSNKKKVARCINKKMKKIKNEKNTKKEKITLAMQLLEIKTENQEKGLQKREQELLKRLAGKYKQNFKDDKISKTYRGSEKENDRKNTDSFEIRKRMHEEDDKNVKFKKKQGYDSVERLAQRGKFNKIKKEKHFSKFHKNLKENKYNNDEYENYDTYIVNKDNDYSTIGIENDPIDKLTEKILNIGISNKDNVVTFREIALALREKELVRKLQEYNNNLKNRINDIALLNRLGHDSNSEKDKHLNVKKRKYFKHDKKIINTSEDSKVIVDKKYLKREKYKNQKAIFNSNAKKYLSGENSKPRKMKVIENHKEYKKYFNSKEKTNNLRENKQEIKQPKYIYKFTANRKNNTIKNKYYNKPDPRDELYIKYNPLKDTIDIVNISKSEDKNFILLENSNKTINGQWYINLHHARSMLRSKEKTADWYFDRVLYRELKRNKAKWYFDYMSGRQNIRECLL